MSVESATPEVLQNGLSHLSLDEKVDPDASAQPNPTESTSKPAARKLPFEAPAASSTRPDPVELTPGEQTKYDDVLAHMKALENLPTTSNKKNKETAPLSDVEQYFLTKDCILRYLRATKWNVHEAKKRIEGTIVWRREYGTDTMTAETIEPEVSSLLQGKWEINTRAGVNGETNVTWIRCNVTTLFVSHPIATKYKSLATTDSTACLQS